MIVSAVIPARIGSTRLPRKVLADIEGHPMVWHVWSRVLKAKGIAEVYIATDSEEVAGIAEKFGVTVLMTSPDCCSGTERIASVIDDIKGDFILNVQGDEPLIDPELIGAIASKASYADADILTPVFKITDFEDLNNPNMVKVARCLNGRALYFSRNPIPHVRGLSPEKWLQNYEFWGHIGVYGYRRKLLESYFELTESDLEKAESLEQLRFLEAGYSVHTIETNYRPIAVDTAEDLEEVRKKMGVK